MKKMIKSDLQNQLLLLPPRNLADLEPFHTTEAARISHLYQMLNTGDIMYYKDEVSLGTSRHLIKE